MTVIIQFTEKEAKEYLQYKEFKGRQAEKISALTDRLKTLAMCVYNAIDRNGEGIAEIISMDKARAALDIAERILDL